MESLVYRRSGKMRRFTAVSLFCGAGGLDMGFERAGFDIVWANDFDKDACQTHRLWSHATVVQGDIEKIESKDIPDTDILLGGFPCQGFSLSGPRRLDDSRNKLYQQYVRIVRDKHPLAFVGENVKGLLTMDKGAIFKAILEDFSKQGYIVFYKLVNAKNYGVPQDRERVILCGFRKDLGVKEFVFPEPIKQVITLREVIGNEKEPVAGMVCQEPYSSRYMSRNRKRSWDAVSFTIPAMAKQVPLWSGSPDMVKVSKDLWKFGEGNTRRFSWKEVALIQTFPSDMQFVGNLSSVYRQIGNAVPVRLAEEIGKAVYQVLIKVDKNF